MNGGNIHLLSNLVDAQALVQTAQIANTQHKVSRLPTTTSSSSTTSAVSVSNHVTSWRADGRTNQSSHTGSKYNHVACSMNDFNSRATGTGNVSTYSEYHERALSTYAVLIREELNQLMSSLRGIKRSTLPSSDSTVDPIIETMTEIKETELADENDKSAHDIEKIIIKEVLQSIIEQASSRCDVNDVDMSRVGEVVHLGLHALIPPFNLDTFPSYASSSRPPAPLTTSDSLLPSDTTSDLAAFSIPLPLPPVIPSYWEHTELSGPVIGQPEVTPVDSSTSTSSSSSSRGGDLPPSSSSSDTSLLLTSSQSSNLRISSLEYGTSTPLLASDSTPILPGSPRILQSMKDPSVDEEVDLIESERKRGKITLLDHLYLQEECGLGLSVLCDSDHVLHCEPNLCAKPGVLSANLYGTTVASIDAEISDRDVDLDQVKKIGYLHSAVKKGVEEMVEEGVGGGVEGKMDTDLASEQGINKTSINIGEIGKKNGFEIIERDHKKEVEEKEDHMVIELKEEVENDEEQNIEDGKKNVNAVQSDVNMGADTNTNMKNRETEAVEGAADMTSQLPEVKLNENSSPSANMLNIRSDHPPFPNKNIIRFANPSVSVDHVQETSCSDSQSISLIPHASTYWKDISYVSINSKSILVRVGDSLSERTFPSSVPQSLVAIKSSREFAAEKKIRAIQKLEESLEKNLKYSKKRKKNRIKEKKKENILIENNFQDSPVPKKVPRQVIEDISPHNLNTTSLPSSLRLSENIQKCTANFSIEKYSFFDQVCSFYEKKKKQQKLIGKKHFLYSHYLNDFLPRSGIPTSTSV